MIEGRWTTQKGDEWWYSDRLIEAEAGYNQCPEALVVGDLKTRGQSLTDAMLHSFLWTTMQQLKGAQVWLLLTSTMRTRIEALGSSGAIAWEIIDNPLSKLARVTFVSKPGIVT